MLPWRPALACALVLARAACADPGEFRGVVSTARPPYSEDYALHGFLLLDRGAAGARGAGTIGRAYSLSADPSNTVWGIVAEAINFPEAAGHAVGTESAVVNMAPDKVGEIRGLHVVFKDRMDMAIDEPVPVVGQNRFNENSSAIYVSSQPRSPAGEYSGWQSGIKFDRHSLDRSVSIPYAAAVDVSEVEVPATFYLIVWRCGQVKCGLKPTGDGAVVVRDIEHLP
jgi:hypothetical protein